jgi:hypothetical protein
MKALKQLLIILFLGFPYAVQAQFNYTTSAGSITITKYTGVGGNVVIPSTTNGYPVTAIGDNAFFLNATIAMVTILNGVTNIGYNAFAGCSHLANVTIPNSVINIASNAFYNCPSLTNATIPDGVTSIGNEAFEYCSGLTSVTIPSRVTKFGQWAFGYCSGLTNVTIPNGVPNIEYAAFAFCSGLTVVTIPNSVTNLGLGVFAQCSSLHQAFFQGNAPSVNGGSGSTDISVFFNAGAGKVYYLPGTTGWDTSFGGWPTVLWNPQMQTADNDFGVRTNGFGFNLTGTADIPVVVEASTNWGGVWTTLFNGTITNGSIYFSDPQWTNYPARYYRFRSP